MRSRKVSLPYVISLSPLCDPIKPSTAVAARAPYVIPPGTLFLDLVDRRRPGGFLFEGVFGFDQGFEADAKPGELDAPVHAEGGEVVQPSLRHRARADDDAV